MNLFLLERLEEAEEKFRSRQSRPEDLEVIEQLKRALAERELDMKKLVVSDIHSAFGCGLVRPGYPPGKYCTRKCFPGFTMREAVRPVFICNFTAKLRGSSRLSLQSLRRQIVGLTYLVLHAHFHE